MRRRDIERIEGALLVEGGVEAWPSLEPEEGVPHLLEQRADRRLARDEAVAVAPSGDLHRAHECTPEGGELLGLFAGGLEAAELLQELFELYGAKAQERLVSTRGGVDECHVHRGARVAELAEVLRGFERMVRAHRRPERTHSSRQRFAARALRPIAIAGGRTSELRGVGDRHRHVVGRTVSRQEQQSEQDRDPEGNDREAERIEKFGPTGTAVLVH